MSRVVKYIFSGTFSMNKHRKEYRDSKFDREIDIFTDYACQLPLFKLVTIPITYCCWIVYLLWIFRGAPLEIAGFAVGSVKNTAQSLKAKYKALINK